MCSPKNFGRRHRSVHCLVSFVVHSVRTMRKINQQQQPQQDVDVYVVETRGPILSKRKQKKRNQINCKKMTTRTRMLLLLALFASIQQQVVVVVDGFPILPPSPARKAVSRVSVVPVVPSTSTTTTALLRLSSSSSSNNRNKDGNNNKAKPLLQGDIAKKYTEIRFNAYTNPTGDTPIYQNSLKEKGTFVQTLFDRRQVVQEDDDGYQDMRAAAGNNNNNMMRNERPLWKRVVQAPLKFARDVLLFPAPPVEPGTLILVRHGESLWNANKTFTGWADPDLSERGFREIEHAARLLLEGGYEIDLVFTSRLKRAIRSVWIILQEMNQVYKPVFKSWRLNERFYGALTGLCKFETAEQLGVELVQEWRGSLRSRPPMLTENDIYWPGRDRRYADLSSDQIPLTESLLDCMERTAPVWEDKIKYELSRGRNVCVVAHANTLRGLVKTIDNISDEDIQEVSIPTGIPIIYKFSSEMKPVPPNIDRTTVSQKHMNGLFLENPTLLKEAFKREEEWSKHVPGYNATLARRTSSMTSLERSLYKLRAERELGEWAGQFIDPTAIPEDDGSDGNQGKPMQIIIEDKIWEEGLKSIEQGDQFDPDLPEFHSVNGGDTRTVPIDDSSEVEPVVVPNIISNQPCIQPLPSQSLVPGIGNVPTRRDAVIVIIRHGKTEHNKLGLFTGWEDAPLAKEGIEEAKEAGRLLKRYGFEFDLVYTSWLSRAIETAWHVLSEMDCLWLPMIKTWRLNERMYGQLTGLSKKMVKQRHGDAQFKAWRRGYDTPPPPVSSFSQHYPGNDQRYEKYLNDVRFSFRESLIRSIEKGRPKLSRKLPKTESLKDCMDRTIPFFTECIIPDAINQGKRVLISSSENAIRGLLMHLCEIPEDKITELEIPNGLPIIFDFKSKCVKLLDDGTGRDPLEVHNFGKAASYLFRPCVNEDGSPDEECIIRVDEPVSLTAAEKATIEAIKAARV